jgi:hypothetical protein
MNSGEVDDGSRGGMSSPTRSMVVEEADSETKEGKREKGKGSRSGEPP